MASGVLISGVGERKPGNQTQQVCNPNENRQPCDQRQKGWHIILPIFFDMMPSIASINHSMAFCTMPGRTLKDLPSKNEAKPNTPIMTQVFITVEVTSIGPMHKNKLGSNLL
jgi:hypothetical protein